MSVAAFTQTLALRKVHVILAVVALIAISGCVKEAPGNLIDCTETESEVKLSIKVPGETSGGTRGMSDVDECTVNEIDVLVFNGTNMLFKYARQATNIVATSNSVKNFEVTLPYGLLDIMVVANASSIIQAASLTPGMTKAQVVAALTSSLPANSAWPNGTTKWPDGSLPPLRLIPMWGEKNQVTYDQNTSLTGSNAIKMTRMVAKVQLFVQSPADADFELQCVYLYNYNTRGLVCPNQNSGITNGIVVNPSLPASLGKVSGVDKPLKYIRDVADPDFTNNRFVNTLYTYEAVKGNINTQPDHTCIVVGGRYKGGTDTTFYRLDFAVKNAATNSYDYKPLLRNHNYELVIKRVSGPGFPTHEEAFNSGPVNMEIDILNWNDAGMGNVAFNGYNILSVSRGEVELFRDALSVKESHNYFTVYADYAGYPTTEHSWQIVSVTDAPNGGGNPVSWLTPTPTFGNEGSPTDVVLTHVANPNSTPRNAYITIRSANLFYTVKVTQLIEPNMTLIPYAPARPDVEITELVFDGNVAETKELKIRWAPPASSLYVNVNMTGSADFPASTGTGNLTPVNNTTIAGSTDATFVGMKSYTYSIRPPVLTQSEINGDPFINKESKVTFSVNNGVSSIYKEVLLKQLNFRIIDNHDAINGYKMDGSSYEVIVKSNVPWRIKSVVENIAPQAAVDANKHVIDWQSGHNLVVGNTGGSTVGDTLRFTTVNSRGFWGNIKIVLEDTGTPKRVADHTILLIFPLPKIKILCVGTGQWNPAYDAGANSPGRMLNNQGGFGMTESSKVYSLGFEFLRPSPSTYYNETHSATTIANLLTNANAPDIVIFTYNCTNFSSIASTIKTYAETKGTVIIFCEYAAGMQTFARSLFGNNNINYSRTGDQAGSVYKMEDVADEIIYGPFSTDIGSLANKYNGEDDTGFNSMTNYPKDSIVVYSYAWNYSTNRGQNASGNLITTLPSLTQDNLAVFMWRHVRLPIFVCGDGGNQRNNDPNGYYYSPFLLDATNNYSPKDKPNYGYGTGTRYTVTNSRLFGNLLLWGITNSLK
ncbi:MAG: hypothetical protein LBH06_10155 [Rikenellaceae bacterium]|jgi:hypothetical protein|nr:hypothetical protein [Rikenellaceae bacterium]